MKIEFLNNSVKVWIVLLVFILGTFPKKTQAQNYETHQNQLLAYNILLNGILGGVGGAINKAPGEKTWKAFIKNFGKGSLGGLIKYSAKYQTYYLRNSSSTYLAPVNRMFFFLGHSMVMNASMNKKLLSHYNFNLYGFDMVMNFEKGGQKFFTTRLSLVSVYGASYFLIAGHRFNLYKSLEYGVLYFDLNPSMTKYAGFATFNCVAIGKNAAGNIYYHAIPHEMVHTYQFYDYHAISSMYTPAMMEKYQKIKLYRILSPYVKFDYEAAFQGLLYMAQPTPKYYKNFYEFEAQHFSGRAYIKR